MSSRQGARPRYHPSWMRGDQKPPDDLITPGMLLEIFDQPIMFRRAFVDLTGTVTAALLLTYACAASQDPDVDDDLWVTRSMEQWMDNTGMSRTELESARRRLRELDLLEERRAGPPPATMQYRVSAARLSHLLRGHADKKYVTVDEARLSQLMRQDA